MITGGGRDLLDVFNELMRDQHGVTVPVAPDSPGFSALLEALRRVSGEPPPLAPAEKARE